MKRAIYLVLIVIIVLSVCGCSGLGTIVTSPEKQKAYDDLQEKLARVNYCNETYAKLSEQADTVDVSTTTEAKTLIDNAIFAADNYITACDDALYASRVYRSYLDTRSSEYQHYVDLEALISENSQETQKEKKALGTCKEALNELDIWLNKLSDLTDKFEEAESLTTPDQLYKWFISTRPVLDGYLTESDILIALIDNATALADPGKARESLVDSRNKVVTANSQLKSQYNVLVEAYNNAYGSMYGQVSKI
jgi:hypothetical protein